MISIDHDEKIDETAALLSKRSKLKGMPETLCSNE